MFEEDVSLFVYEFMTVQSVKDLRRREFELSEFRDGSECRDTTTLYIEKNPESGFWIQQRFIFTTATNNSYQAAERANLTKRRGNSMGKILFAMCKSQFAIGESPSHAQNHKIRFARPHSRHIS